MSPRRPPAVTLYARPDCHLCADALIVLLRVREDLAFELQRCNVDDDEALLRTYLERIPVVAIDGEEVFELFVDEAELRRRLATVSQR